MIGSRNKEKTNSNKLRDNSNYKNKLENYPIF